MSQPRSDATTVTVPARAEFLHLIRSVVASVAARRGLTLDAIEDLRLAVDEACAQLLRAHGAALTVRIRPTDDGIEVRSCTDGDAASWPPEGFEGGLAAQVLGGLADEVRWGSDEHGRPEIAVSMRAPEPARP